MEEILLQLLQLTPTWSMVLGLRNQSSPLNCTTVIFLAAILLPHPGNEMKPSFPVSCFVMVVVYRHSLLQVTSCSQPMSRQLFSPVMHK
jgi:hypothetical protein